MTLRGAIQELYEMREDTSLPVHYALILADVIDTLRTDAQEVRHGEWIKDEFGSRCGACGLYAYRDKFDKPWESPYCPNCGALMVNEDD